jgi:hypothetical protein
MRQRLFVLVVLVAGLSALAVGSSAVAGPTGSAGGTACVSTTQLRPENEVPPTTSTAFGHTQIKVRNDGTIAWKTVIFNPGNETFVAGHIHVGRAGTNGGVVQGLFSSPGNSDSEITHSGSASNPTVAAAICADPSNYYVNYHTTVFPGGAIRGQLG